MCLPCWTLARGFAHFRTLASRAFSLQSLSRDQYLVKGQVVGYSDGIVVKNVTGCHYLFRSIARNSCAAGATTGRVHSSNAPHQDQPRLTAGTPLADASVAVILVHGRGASARSIIGMADQFGVDGVAYLAPQAAMNTWYPNAFTEPVETNEPGRTSGLQAIADAVDAATDAGIPVDHVVVLGFSQGACLASEFIARNPERYGGLVALSGGLIGQSIDPEDYAGDLDGMPVFFGCSDVDPHIPAERVHTSADVFERLNADVETRLYPGMGHGVNDDEIEYVSALLAKLA